MNRYQFIRNARPVMESKVFTAEDEKGAILLSDIDAIIDASKTIGKYEFKKDDALTEKLRKMTSASRYSEARSDGSIQNRMTGKYGDSNILLRVFGTREEMPAKEYTPAEIAKLNFGYCFSDGEQVTNLRADRSGRLTRVPVLYVEIV